MRIKQLIEESAQALAGEGNAVIVAGVSTLNNPDTNLPEALKKVLILTVTPDGETLGAYRLSEPAWSAPNLRDGQPLPASAFSPIDDPQPPFTVEAEVVTPYFVSVTIDGVFVRGSNTLPVDSDVLKEEIELLLERAFRANPARFLSKLRHVPEETLMPLVQVAIVIAQMRT